MGENLILLTSRISHAGVSLPFAEPPPPEPAPATWTEWLRILATSGKNDSQGVEGLEEALAMPLHEALPHLLPKAETLLAYAVDHLCESDWADWLKLPLVGAASQGDIETVAALLRAGAGGRDRGIGAWIVPGGDGRTLLHAAANSGQASVVEALLDAGAGVVVNIHAGLGFSPFHVAAISGSVQVAMALASAGAAVRCKAPYKESALHLAATMGNHAMVSSLAVRLRLPVEGCDAMGATALHAAAWHGQVDCVRVLLDLGASVDSRDDCDMTPLFKAARRGGWAGCEVMRELLHAGAEVRTSSADGETPLHVACRHAHAHAVRLLLRHDADETAKCDKRKTPGDVTKEEEGRSAVSSDAAKEVYDALASAPAGRAWRRRGWLVMLRVRSIKAECEQVFWEGGGARGAVLAGWSGQMPPTAMVVDACVDDSFYNALSLWESESQLPFQVLGFGSCDSSVQPIPFDLAAKEEDGVVGEGEWSWSADRATGRMCQGRTRHGASWDCQGFGARDMRDDGLLHDLVTRTLELADGAFQIIVGYL